MTRTIYLSLALLTLTASAASAQYPNRDWFNDEDESASTTQHWGGMHQDRSGRWVNQYGGNLYGDSQINPDADPRINPKADPLINPYADPRINPKADPLINPDSDPNISPYGGRRY
jgi:hypothetical protein